MSLNNSDHMKSRTSWPKRILCALGIFVLWGVVPAGAQTEGYIPNNLAEHAPIRHSNLNDIRNAINTKRTDCGMTSWSWTPTGVGQWIRKVHLSECRDAINNIYTDNGQSAYDYAEKIQNIKEGRTRIKAFHFQELYTALTGAVCCGDGTCDGSLENIGSCPADCCNLAASCGDGTCDAGCEDPGNCRQDCKCDNNGICEEEFGEDCINCAGDCQEELFCSCGVNGCEAALLEDCDSCPGDCGACCGNGQCDAPYDLINCPGECTCDNDGICDPGEDNPTCPDECPCDYDGICDPDETNHSCPDDCPCDFNGTCDGDETNHSCPDDCPCDFDGTCDPDEVNQGCPGDCPCDNDGTCDANETNHSCPNDCPCNKNGICDADEDAAYCPEDCVCNNDGTCDAGETPVNCFCDCSGPLCGNGNCDSSCSEDSSTCPQDCPGCNNDGVCGPGEDIGNCSADCCGDVCGDGSCDTICNESTTCPGDCGACDNDGSCESGEDSFNCPNDCCAPLCGNFTCNTECDEATSCAGDCPECGNSTCDPGENPCTCPVDCAVGFCGDTCCALAESESCVTCAGDCGDCCGNTVCQPSLGETCSVCPADCSGCPCPPGTNGTPPYRCTIFTQGNDQQTKSGTCDQAGTCSGFCDNGTWSWNNGCDVYVCTDPDPDPNASLCPFDDENLTANTPKVLAAACTSPKCQYVCDPGYTLSGGSCKSGCPATSKDGCSLAASAHGQTSGSCPGNCSYQCDNGTWTLISNTCTGPACTNNDPDPNSSLCPLDDQGLTVDTPKTLASSCSSPAGSDPKCQYVCDSGYYKSGSSCSAYVCTGQDPAHATMCSSDDVGLNADTAKTVVSGCTNPVKCEFICDTGYYASDNACVPYQCQGNDPAHATLCVGDSTELTADTAKVLAASCSSPIGSSPKCQFTCDSGYGISGNNCVPQCTGPDPVYANLCAGDATGLTAPTAKIVVPSCTNTEKCEFTCNTNYRISAGACVPDCFGADPDAHSSLCPMDDESLSSPTAKVLASSCSSPMGSLPKCQYTCDSGYTLSGGACKAGCSATTNNGCSLDASDHNQTSGTCAESGNCNYRCDNGSWTELSNNCTGFSCTNNDPDAHASLCTDDDKNLTANTAKTLVASCSSPAGSLPKCEYICNTGYTLSGGVCVAVSCTNPDPDPNSSICPQDDENLAVNTPKTLAGSCSSPAGSLPKCEYVCDAGYVKSGNACVPVCTGDDPANAAICTGDGTGLSVPTAKTVVSTCTTQKCEFLCSSGYNNVNGVCVPVCRGNDPANASICTGDGTGLTAPVDKTLVGSCSSPAGSDPKCEYTCQTSPAPGYTRAGGACHQNCSADTNGSLGNRCSVAAANHGQTVAGTCDAYGSCSASCSDGVWTWDNRCKVSEFLCPATTNGSAGSKCTVPGWDSYGLVSGSCDEEGDCKAVCNIDGAWSDWNNTCNPFDCTPAADPDPNASICPNDDTGLTADTTKTLVASCTSPKCQFICDSGYTLYSGACRANCSGQTIDSCTIAAGTYTHGQIIDGSCSGTGACRYSCSNGSWIAVNNTCAPPVYSCTGTLSNAGTMCPNDDQDLTADTAKLAVTGCTSTRKCEYLCDTGYTAQNGVCTQNCEAAINNYCSVPSVPRGTANVGACAGCGGSCSYTCNASGNWVANSNTCGAYCCQNNAPANATICTDDDIDLTANTPRTLVGSCTSDKCEYTCSPGYTLQNGVCTQNCEAAINNYCSVPSVPRGTANVGSCAGCGGSCNYTCNASGNWVANSNTCGAYCCYNNAPANATICTDDDIGLTANTARILVDSCGSAKCEYTCDTGYYKSGASSCSSCPYGAWTDVGCGANGCTASQMRQQQTSTQAGCPTRYQCVTSGTCGAVCPNFIREGTEECDQYDFGGASCSSLGYSGGSLSCAVDCKIITTGCTCSYDPWTDVGCGQGGCAAGEMRQQQTSTATSCSTQYRCVASAACGYTCQGTHTNGTMCPGDDTGLTANTAKTAVASCSSPAGSSPKCQYTCNAGTTLYNNACHLNCTSAPYTNGTGQSQCTISTNFNHNVSKTGVCASTGTCSATCYDGTPSWGNQCTVCGNGTCDTLENGINCPQDCCGSVNCWLRLENTCCSVGTQTEGCCQKRFCVGVLGPQFSQCVPYDFYSCSNSADTAACTGGAAPYSSNFCTCNP